MATDTTTAAADESGWKAAARELRPAVEFLGACFALGAVMVGVASAIVVVNEIFAEHNVWAQTGPLFRASVQSVLGVPLGVTYALFVRYVFKLVGRSAPSWESVGLWGAAGGGSLVFAVELVSVVL